ncbi:MULTISPECIES: RNA polymerase sigma factor [Mycobacteroides]|jgi:RNA polymerase sigma-70 factor (ECF subfamily)|uniref:RNA polymerase subunit sigma-24 n=1 Tax=Mycobacteroides chelonae TaxID=1774 RepID=A0AB73N6W2_MYCCH|nr:MULTISPECIES: RNA polymerase sigma factor [Mycobacteroides]KRQ28007.1 RNA polymerase subunit sigma-24 [Mycobacteroides sp. H072]KRQ41571.1 RNA polymerase subunit sigma-24 [Mycobacteroides sp. H002]KRQ49886.1 RNA polymerase subunit sigma-24 [Mycobacteroides sp. H054]KRQ67455.1 RNA polymerase subunit sigma-24 [Mycobacteroides sp. H001]MBF9423053.1 RNA polymerase sigma factor [Mycobacteroides chelonae]
MHSRDAEAALVASLQAGDEGAFAQVVDAHTPAMLQLARSYVRSREIAEEVVQEAWLALCKGIDAFEGRSTLRTWLFTILINIAKERGIRERRDTAKAIAAFTGGTVDPGRFQDTGEWVGHWRDDAAPHSFPETPENLVLSEELLAHVVLQLDGLPETQRVVVTMRDLLGLDSKEVAEHLGITSANQRVLLHRGRAAVRQGLEDYMKDVS